MALLSSKPSFPTTATSSSSQMPGRNFSDASHRTQVSSAALQDGIFTSPTNSEFSDVSDGLGSIRAWDEKRVVDWLHTIRCGQYEQLFKSNNVTGDSLLECDQRILSEMGIKKIGDRVRINVAIKQLRNKSSSLRTRRNRDSLAALEGYAVIPSSSESPRNYGPRSQNGSAKRFSRQIDPSVLQNFNSASTGFKVGSPSQFAARRSPQCWSEGASICG